MVLDGLIVSLEITDMAYLGHFSGAAILGGPYNSKLVMGSSASRTRSDAFAATGTVQVSMRRTQQTFGAGTNAAKRPIYRTCQYAT